MPGFRVSYRSVTKVSRSFVVPLVPSLCAYCNGEVDSRVDDLLVSPPVEGARGVQVRADDRDTFENSQGSLEAGPNPRRTVRRERLYAHRSHDPD